MEKKTELIERLEQVKQENLEGGGLDKIEKQHAKGLLSARERIDQLADSDSFGEFGSAVRATDVTLDDKVKKTPCDGAITGMVKVNGRNATVFASDFTIMAASIGSQHMAKFSSLLEWSGEWGVPFFWLLDSSGARLTLAGSTGSEWNRTVYFATQGRYSGLIPQIYVLLGPCVAGHAYGPILSDFLIMTRKTSWMWLGGPRMVKAATTEEMMTTGDIGGADYHMMYSGSCDIVAENDEDAIEKAKILLSYIPQNCWQEPPFVETGDDPNRRDDELIHLIPEDPNATYDMHEIIKRIVDNGEFFELKEGFAKQVITGFCRFGGRSVGIVANNPSEPGSIFENNACDKYCRFLRFIDAFNIPLITLTDTADTLPGEEWERKGLLRHGGKIIYAYSVATIPKVNVIIRHAYGDAGSIIMGSSKGLGTDICYAWPTADVAVEASKLDLVNTFGLEQGAYENYLWRAKEKVGIFDTSIGWTTQIADEIIDPSNTRRRIIDALSITEGKLGIKVKKLPEKASNHGVPPA